LSVGKQEYNGSYKKMMLVIPTFVVNADVVGHYESQCYKLMK